MSVTPMGQEPERVRKRMDALFVKLDEAYPDKVIRGLEKEHKKWAETVRELYRLLGYENGNEFLQAYGYTVERMSGGGRPPKDYTTVIEELKRRYPNGAPYTSTGALEKDNPDLAARLKTLVNEANKLFGMSFSAYLAEIGILLPRKSAPTKKADGEPKQKTANFFWALIEGADASVPCVSSITTLHEGDLVLMTANDSGDAIRGLIQKTCFHFPEDEMPCPTEEMHQLVRKITRTEIREAEAAKEKYLFCMVRLQGSEETLYYLSPFEEIGVGDLVRVPYGRRGERNGLVAEIIRVSEKTAPFPVKKTKNIIEILRSIRSDQTRIQTEFDELVRMCGSESCFSRPAEPISEDGRSSLVYFSGAVFRGLDLDVLRAMQAMDPFDPDPLSHREKLCGGIGQFTCDSARVLEMLEAYPNLKAVCFAENWKKGTVYLAYSESGHPAFTVLREIGSCDFYSRDRWTLLHDPTEDAFSVGGLRYRFEEKALWEKLDYVLPGGEGRLSGDILVPSRPYRKQSSADPCCIIEIRYPEHEEFYTPAP